MTVSAMCHKEYHLAKPVTKNIIYNIFLNKEIVKERILYVNES